MLWSSSPTTQRLPWAAVSWRTSWNWAALVSWYSSTMTYRYLRAAGGEGVGMPGEKPQCQQNQVVEIHGVAGAQGALVARADVLGQRGDVGVGEDGRARAAVFVAAQKGEHFARIGLGRPCRRCG